MAGTGKGPGKLVCQSRAKEGDRQEVNRGVCVSVCLWWVGGVTQLGSDPLGPSKP